MARKPHTIDSIEELQRVVPSVVKAVNAEQALARGALVNPLLALEELGYELSPALKPVTERRVRFSRDKATRIEALAGEVHKLAGRQFDIDAPHELMRVLFEELKLPRGGAKHARQERRAEAAAAVPLTRPEPAVFGAALSDPLEHLRDAHPVMKPLLEYRRLEASEPRLASRELYERIRNGEVALPVTHVRARLKRGPTPE